MNKIETWIIKKIVKLLFKDEALISDNCTKLFKIIIEHVKLSNKNPKIVEVSFKDALSSFEQIYLHKSPTGNRTVNKIYSVMRSWTNGPKVLFVLDTDDEEIKQMSFNPDINVVLYSAPKNILIHFLRDFKRSKAPDGIRLRVAPTFYFLNEELLSESQKLQPLINSILINRE